MTLDGERPRAPAEDLDLARRARLDPEGRALRSGVAQQRSEDERLTAGILLGPLPTGGQTDRDGARLDLYVERAPFRGPRRQLVQHLAVELHLDAARLRGAHERGSGRAPGRGARERASPVHHAVGVHHPELELAVLGARILERLDAAEQLSDVADEDAARPVVVPAHTVHRDLRLERLRRRFFDPVQT